MSDHQEVAVPQEARDPDGFRNYLREVRKTPLLEASEEYELATQWAERQDPKAFEKLIKSHLMLVAKIAAGYRGYGLPMNDLVAEGNIGMMQAVMRFDPARGVRLSTYASWWIRAAIQEYILHSWSMVKIGTTAHQKKLFFNLRRLKQKIEHFDDSSQLSDEHAQQIATELNVPVKDVHEMHGRLHSHDLSLNAPVGMSDGEGESQEWQDWLEADNSGRPDELAMNKDEMEKRMTLLRDGLKRLSDRELEIFTVRRLQEPPVTLGALSDKLHLSRERVRQIEVQAFTKVQKYIAAQEGARAS